MINYFETNGLTIRAVVENSYPKIGDEDRVEIQQNWGEIARRKPGAFNGRGWSCHGFEVRGKTIEMRINEVDYATYIWARNNKLAIPGAWMMGTGTMLFDTDNNLVLVRRTSGVVTDPGKISGARGVVDTSIGPERGIRKMIGGQMRKELAEEMVLRRRKMTMVGMAVDSGTLKVEWGFLVRGKGVGIRDGEENTEIILVPRGDIQRFVREENDRLELSTGWHLGYWAGRIDQLLETD